MKTVALGRVLTVLSLVTAGTAWSATTPPPAGTTWSPPTEKLDRIQDLLRRGSDMAALDAVNDLLKNAPELLPPMAEEPATLRLCNLAAVANLRAKKPGVAQRYARLTMASPHVSRVMKLNLACAEMQLPVLQMHAVSSLAEFCQAHPKDETAIDLFGVALDRAGQDNTNAQAVKPYQTQYDTLLPALEKQHKGKRRWGTTWVSPKRFKELDGERDAALAKVKMWQRRFDRAQEDVAAADRDYRNDKGSRSKHDGKTNADNLHADSEAREKRSDCEKSLAAAKAAVPAVPWTTPLNGILDDDGAKQ